MILVISTYAVLPLVPASAGHPVIWTPRSVHWRNSHTNWHWGDNLANNHPRFKDPTNAARNRTWEDACCPNSQWHGHFKTGADNHINVKDCDNPDHIACAITNYNGNNARHMTMAKIYFDTQRVNNDRYFTGTGDGDVPNNKFDAWSVAAEEWGHVQNMHHFGSANCDTMSGNTPEGTKCKRHLRDAEKDAAQEPYDLAHPGTSAAALAEADLDTE